jgi:UDP-glucose 4-epimerase
MIAEKMKILVTPAATSAGKELMKHLEKSCNCRIFAPVHNELDLMDPDKVKRFVNKNAIDVIIHAASDRENKFIKDEKNGGKIFTMELRVFFNLVGTLGKSPRMVFLSGPVKYEKNHIPADEFGFSRYLFSRFIRTSKNITGISSSGFAPVDEALKEMYAYNKDKKRAR